MGEMPHLQQHPPTVLENGWKEKMVLNDYIINCSEMHYSTKMIQRPQFDVIYEDISSEKFRKDQTCMWDGLTTNLLCSIFLR